MTTANSAEHGDAGRGIDNLDPVENLLGDDADDAMQTSYSPPDREPQILKDRPTLDDQREGMTVDEYLRQEEPEADQHDVEEQS